MSRPVRWLVIGAVFAAAGLAPDAGPRGLGAQEPGLEAVDSLTVRGDVDRAREVLASWWEREWRAADRSEKQRALWLRGRLTVDPALARRDYARLAVEFPGGPYSAQALHRLALQAAAAGDLVEAADRFRELAAGYPASPLRLDARRWLRANGERVAEARRAEAEAPGETPSPPPAEPSESGEAPPEAVTVQLGAFSTAGRARTFAREFESASGYDARLVRVDGGGGLIRVRVGRFADEAAARELQGRMLELGFDATIAHDAHRERPVS